MKFINVFDRDGVYNVATGKSSAVVLCSDQERARISMVGNPNKLKAVGFVPKDPDVTIEMFPYPFQPNSIYAVLVMGDQITITDSEARVVFFSSPWYTRVIKHTGESEQPYKEWDSIHHQIRTYNGNGQTTTSSFICTMTSAFTLLTTG